MVSKPPEILRRPLALSPTLHADTARCWLLDLDRHNLGVLYENCHQLNDATDAYRTAVVLDPHNQILKDRLKAAQQRKQAQQLAQIQTTAYYSHQS